MSTMASQISSVLFVCSTICSCADQGKHQSSLATDLCKGNPPSPANSPHKGPVTRKMFPFDDIIIFMEYISQTVYEKTCWSYENIFDKISLQLWIKVESKWLCKISFEKPSKFLIITFILLRHVSRLIGTRVVFYEGGLLTQWNVPCTWPAISFHVKTWWEIHSRDRLSWWRHQMETFSA